MELLRVFLFLVGLLSFSYLLIHPHTVKSTSDIPAPALCPHQFLTTESEMTYRESPFALEDDIKEIYAEKLTCSPSSFGYTPEEAAALFPNKTYPTCEERTGYQGKIILLAEDKLSFRLNCGEKQGGIYAVGVERGMEELGDNRFAGNVQEYQGKPVALTTEEYIFASCSKDASVPFEDVVYINRLNSSSLHRAQTSLPPSPPLHILMLVLDSVSRRSLFRKLPLTLSLLNSLPTNFEAFDFKLHNVMGEHSNESFMPTFFGDMEYGRLKSRVYGDPFYEKSLWRKLQDKVSE